jgi:hypothetical protein
MNPTLPSAQPRVVTGLLQFYNDAEDRDRSFIIDRGHGQTNLTIWLPNEPTYTMPDDLAPGAINPWDATLEGREVTATFVERCYNYHETDWGNVWLVTLA